MKIRSVLIIDDDGWLAGEFSRRLTQAGFVVSLAQNALEGIDAVDTYHPDAIILDIFMPGPNGIVLLHELRSHSDLAHVPVIVCTNSAADIPKGNLTKYGVTTVLDKVSMHPDDIVAAVRKALT
ncbi:response regulator [Microbacteriaceae bacterium]|nr:response regulator [Candidatus Saccharibacteria bacterium]